MEEGSVVTQWGQLQTIDANDNEGKPIKVVMLP